MACKEVYHFVLKISDVRMCGFFFKLGIDFIKKQNRPQSPNDKDEVILTYYFRKKLNKTEKKKLENVNNMCMYMMLTK